jgi:hypothetical protein
VAVHYYQYMKQDNGIAVKNPAIWFLIFMGDKQKNNLWSQSVVNSSTTCLCRLCNMKTLRSSIILVISGGWRWACNSLSMEKSPTTINGHE